MEQPWTGSQQHDRLSLTVKVYFQGPKELWAMGAVGNEGTKD